MRQYAVSIRAAVIVLLAWVISVALAVVVTYIKRGSDKDLEWTNRIATSGSTTTTTSTTILLPQKPDSGISRPRPRPTNRPTVSPTPPPVVPCAELEAEVMFLREKVRPQEGVIESETIGRLEYVFDPLTGEMPWHHSPPPLPFRIDSVTTKSGPLFEERPWWEVPAYVAGGILVGVIIDRSVR